MSSGREMQVRALRNIQAGEQLTVTYINLTEDRATRQHQLALSKHFQCACDRCSEPLESSTDRFLEVNSRIISIHLRDEVLEVLQCCYLGLLSEYRSCQLLLSL